MLFRSAEVLDRGCQVHRPGDLRPLGEEPQRRRGGGAPQPTGHHGRNRRPRCRKCGGAGNHSGAIVIRKGLSQASLKPMRLCCLRDQHRIRQSATGEFNTSSIGQSVTGQLGILQSATGKSGSSQIGQTLSDQLAILQTLSGKSGQPPLRPFTLRCR